MMLDSNPGAHSPLDAQSCKLPPASSPYRAGRPDQRASDGPHSGRSREREGTQGRCPIFRRATGTRAACLTPTVGLIRRRYHKGRSVSGCPLIRELFQLNLRPKAGTDVNEDAQWIDDTLAGNTAAFGRLVQKYQDRLFNTLIHVTGSVHEAEDVAQEAFVQAFVKLQTFQRRSSIFTWVYRIAFNLWVTRQRRHRPDQVRRRNPGADRKRTHRYGGETPGSAGTRRKSPPDPLPRLGN